MTNHTYLNFDLLIEPSENGYCSRILSAPSGEGKCNFILPFSAEVLQAFLPLSRHTVAALRLTSPVIDLLERALSIAQEEGNRNMEGFVLRDLGSIYYNLNQYEKAIGYLKKSHAILEKSDLSAASYVYQLLGSSYNGACWASALNGELEVALSYCEEAIKNDPQPPAARSSRGLVYALSGETEKAIADFQFTVDKLKALDDPVYTHYIEKRQGWINALSTGEDPFTDEVLAALREE